MLMSTRLDARLFCTPRARFPRFKRLACWMMICTATVLLGCASASALADDTPSKSEMTIVNGGFDEGEGGSIPAWGWWSRTDDGSATLVESDRPEDKHAVRLEHDGPRDCAFSSDTKFEVEPGDFYEVSAWTKVDRGVLYLAVVSLLEGKVTDWHISQDRIDPANHTGWAKSEFVVEIPGDCDEIYLRFTGHGALEAMVDDVQIRPWKWVKQQKPRVEGFAKTRVREKLDRGLIARPIDGGNVYLGWRLLAEDPNDVGFNVYRRSGENEAVKLNDEPIRQTTDFVDEGAEKGKQHTWFVRPVVDGKQQAASKPAEATPSDEAAPPYVAVPLAGDYTVQKVGAADLDADGCYEYIVKQPGANIDPWEKYWYPSPESYKIEAYRQDGKLLWRYDLGWAIERGIWYSPYVVFDFDGDGKAEVAVKTGEGDPRDPDGRVRTGAEYLTVLDGTSGKPVAQVPWPSREGFEGTRAYNYFSRNQIGVAYLDGKTPCIIAARGTYNIMKAVAYEFHDGRLRELWRWDNKGMPRRFWGQGAHWMHGVDVDADGRDEVVLGSIVLDDNGTILWSTGLGHPDHAYVGDIDPERPGLEIYYGIETRQKERNGMCLVDAATGEILWGHEGYTRHVHSCGMCADITAKYPGSECYSADLKTEDGKRMYNWSRLRTCRGEVISEEKLSGFGPWVAYWNDDLQREMRLGGGYFERYDDRKRYVRPSGRIVGIADVLGDWREEILSTVDGELRIYTTTIPAVDRRPCLMQDPIYRIDAAHATMGYNVAPMTSYDLSSQAAQQ
jgi:rhamnogalacturonan endolyase